MKNHIIAFHVWKAINHRVLLSLDYFWYIFHCWLMNIFLTQFWTEKLLIHKPQPRRNMIPCQSKHSYQAYQLSQFRHVYFCKGTLTNVKKKITEKYWSILLLWKPKSQIRNHIKTFGWLVVYCREKNDTRDKLE